MKSFDYIIVGQGLAGAAVAVQLLKKNRSLLVIDQPVPHQASRVAAGLFNAITGRQLVKTWMADALFPYLHAYYPEVERETGKRFFFPMPLYRPFLSVAEQNEWMAKSADPSYQAYIDAVFTKPSRAGVKDPFGGLLLRQCGYIDTISYLQAVRGWIERHNVFREEPFDERDLLFGAGEGVSYRGILARAVVLCQGTAASGCIGGLPIRPLKGETLHVKSDFADTVIINRGVYVVPDGCGWRVGATYRAHDNIAASTPDARRELEEKLGELVDFSYVCDDQSWGFRPTTPDRRPVLGEVPGAPGLFIFNGLGTKGVSLAPYFSDVFIRWIENKTAMSKDVLLERYKSVYWTSPK